jgi:hypothetical protein
MLDYDTNSRIQAARDHADRLADDILRSRSAKGNGTAGPGWARLGAALAARVDRLRRRKHAPAYQA